MTPAWGATPPCDVAGSGTQLANASANLPAGEWCRLETDNIGILDANGIPIVNWGDSMAYDRANGKLYIAAKKQGIGSPRHFIVFDEDTNRWSFEATPEAWLDTGGHAYDANVSLVNDYGEFFTYDWGRRAWRFDTLCWPNCTAASWTDLGDVGRNNNDVANAMEWFPDAANGEGRLLFFGGLGFTQAWDGTNWEVTSLDSDLPCTPGASVGEGCGWGSLHMLAQYNPVHRVVLVGGGNGEKKSVWKLDSDLRFTRMKDAPASVSLIASTSSGEKSNLSVDPVTGDYIYWGELDRDFWRYDVVEDVWERLLVQTAPSFAQESSNRAVTQAPIGDHGVTAWVWVDGGNDAAMYLYRHAPGSGVPGGSGEEPGGEEPGGEEPGGEEPGGSEPGGEPGGGAPGSDPTGDPLTFEDVCALDSVVRCYGFEDEQDILTGDPNVTHGPSRILPPGGKGSDRYKLCTETPGDRCWMLDADIKSSGNTAMRFEVPSNTPADTSGSFRLNFSDDFTELVKPGTDFDEVWVQWRQRFSPDMLRVWDPGGGWKQVIVGRGDTKEGDFASSCTTEELVLVQKERYMGPSFYHACGVWENMQLDKDTLPPDACPGSAPIAYQHVTEPGYCCRNAEEPCYQYAANEWMTFRMRVHVATWGTSTANLVQVWSAREGADFTLLFDSSISHPEGWNFRTSQDPNYGKVWFLLYNTGKSADVAHPTGFVWYDDLVISREPMPAYDGVSGGDPGGGDPGGGDPGGGDPGGGEPGGGEPGGGDPGGGEEPGGEDPGGELPGGEDPPPPTCTEEELRDVIRRAQAVLAECDG